MADLVDQSAVHAVLARRLMGAGEALRRAVEAREEREAPAS
jgi:hypothetical protein